jgi:hypothetical protein
VPNVRKPVLQVPVLVHLSNPPESIIRITTRLFLAIRPRRVQQPVGIRYSPQRFPDSFNLETVAVFWRRHERGPAYGPQLEELHHKCVGRDGPIWKFRGPDMSRKTAARVVNGKLLLRASYSLPLFYRNRRKPNWTNWKSLAVTHCF